ncbi:hypothetical protein F0L68_33450 [Solihabitans fulvus]|uniref:Uncharacterized protein n=1 Tax=Solihabitans fulvus TaxID=1892852 RepID=A0A5B2WS06_9PSEU|nr:hypothetical protein [Solihabitans fulvus]KAA2253316.1 hypothetical protein F0L68_33450 [Solihabitans fulvus]
MGVVGAADDGTEGVEVVGVGSLGVPELHEVSATATVLITNSVVIRLPLVPEIGPLVTSHPRFQAKIVSNLRGTYHVYTTAPQ